jgi:FkbM family methyltransferase
VKGLSYRAARRKAASLLNGYLMPKLGFKLVRSWPKNFRYEKVGTANGHTILSVTRAGHAPSARVRLREGTSDWLTFDQVFLEEDYDLRSLSRYGELCDLYRRIADQGRPLIVDLGANIGLSPVYFSMTWPEALVVGVEPDLGNFGLLQENVAEHDNIEAMRAGAASRPGKLEIVDPHAGKNAFRTRIGEPGESGVEGITVSAILDRYRRQGCIPFAIKIDIEGAEAELFSGDCGWVDEFPLLVIELHDWLFPGEGTSRNFLNAVSKMDRDFVYLDENIFSIKNRLAAN